MLSQARQGSAWTLRADPCDAPVPEVMPCSLLGRCRDRGYVCKAPPLQSEGTRVHTHAADRTLQAQEGAGPLLQSTLPATATQSTPRRWKKKVRRGPHAPSSAEASAEARGGNGLLQ